MNGEQSELEHGVFQKRFENNNADMPSAGFKSIAGYRIPYI